MILPKIANDKGADMSKDFRKLIQESVKQKQLHPEDIPSLDLYMDQVIALMSEHLGEDGEKEPLTRTMIHNYSKAGVISPIKGKKYSREQILQTLAVYSLKNLLSISQIKRILNGVEQSGAGEKGLENCFHTQLERRANINAQLMTIEAARTRKREDIYRAAMLDPHTAAELSIDDIVKMCDDLIQAHGDYMAMYK